MPFMFSCCAVNLRNSSLVSGSQIQLLRRRVPDRGFCYCSDRDTYESLGVFRNASHVDINKAFHVMEKKHQPDGKSNSSVKTKFQQIRDAYQVLQDSRRRAQGDGMLSMEPKNTKGDHKHERSCDHASADSFSDSFRKIFSQFFEREREAFAAPLQVEVSLSFSEAAKGCKKHVSFEAQIRCNSCYGSGHSVEGIPKVCSTCKGLGKVTVPPFTSTCNSCHGLGHIIKESCFSCMGSGINKGSKEIDLNIPAGVDSGDAICIPKAGNSGKGVQPGDLIIKLSVAPDPVYIRDGADLYVNSHISFTKAILGGFIEVPTFCGMLQLKIPNGVQHGKRIILRGKGLPKQIGFADRGDQYVTFQIQFPRSLNKRQRMLLEEFAKEEIANEMSASTEQNWLYEELSAG